MKKFLAVLLAFGLLGSSTALADGRGRGYGHYRDGCYDRDYKYGKHAFKKWKKARGYANGPAYPGYHLPYPPYPPGDYGYYSSCPPPPAYGPYYRRGGAVPYYRRGVHGRVGVEIIF